MNAHALVLTQIGNATHPQPSYDMNGVIVPNTQYKKTT